jgi:hypothetical protein
MKKVIFIAVLFMLHVSCSSTKSSMMGWVGESKQKLIETLGPPIRVLDNDKEGKVLVYAEQIFTNSDNSEGSRIAGPNYWNYNYMYVNKEGQIFSCRKEKQNYPPQALDSNKLSTMNLLTVK